MNGWLEGQMDFAYFACGLLYFFLAVSAQALRNQRKSIMPWGWLLTFGLLCGIHLWIEAAFYDLRQTLPALHPWLLLLRMLAFLCLLEFGRKGLATLQSRWSGLWLYPLLLGIGALVAWCSEERTAQAVLRYGFLFPACILATLALRNYCRSLPVATCKLNLATISMALYGVLTGLIPGQAAWPPASFLNTEQFRELFNTPPQVIRAGLVLLIGISLWRHHRSEHAQNAETTRGLAWWYYLRYLIPLVAGLVIAGWVITEQVGQHAEQHMQNEALLRGRLLAAAVNHTSVEALSGTRADLESPRYQHLKKRLMSLQSANNQTRFLYLVGLREGKVFFFLDSESPTSKNYSAPGDIYDEASADLRRVFQTGLETIEGPLPDRWGVWVSAFAPIKDEAGRVLAVAGIDIDANDWAKTITQERFWPILVQMIIMLILLSMFIFMHHWRDVAEQLAVSEQQYRALFENNTTPMILLDPAKGVALDVNSAAAAYYGYARERMVGMAMTEINVLDTPDPSSLLQLTQKQPLTYHTQHRLANGDLREVNVLLSPLYVRNRRCLFAIIQDVTAQLHAEQAAEASELRFRSICNAMIELMAVHELVFDAAGQPVNYRILNCNDAYTRLLGIPRERAVGNLATQVYGLTEAPYLETYARVAQTGEPAHFETFFPPMQKYFSISVSSPAKNQFATVATDITERKLDEAQLRLQSAALSAAASGIVITDATGQIIWVNPAFLQSSGYTADEVIGKNPRVLKSGQHPPEFYATMWRTLTAGEVWSGEVVNRRKDGHLYTEEMTITPVRNNAGAIEHFVAIKQDVTAERELQQQFLQAQRMESIGRLAAGVAHDFNNQLQGILGFGDLLKRSTDQNDPRYADIEEVIKAAQQAAAISRQLLNFSRRQPADMHVLDLNKVIRDGQPMHQRVLGEDIKFELQLAAGLDRIKANAGLIDQILMNLLINARDAMPQGGRLTISTFNITLEARDLGQWNDAHPGRFIVLAVSDTGAGVAPEHLPHIFEPFFTTKEKGRGTGLGLASVYGIARQHGGWVHVYSQQGTGTTFKVYLPALADAATLATDIATAANEPIAKGQNQRILLVEDEAGVRLLAQRVLQENNYTVTSAASVAEAVKLFESATTPFELIFSDVVLPDGNGLDLIEKLLLRQPTLRVIMASGYTDERSRWATIQARGFRFLSKPYPVALLLRALQETFAAPIKT